MRAVADWYSTAGFLAKLGKTALPLVASDAVLQGCRYGLVAYLGILSLSLLGSYLFGSAIGALAAVAIDFGINQHWLRLDSVAGGLTRQAFTRVLAVKLVLSLILVAGFVLLMEGGFWSRPFPAMVVTGLIMANLHALVETCESVGFLFRRHHLVALVRVVLGLMMYAMPAAAALFMGRPSGEVMIQPLLSAGLLAGLLILSGYVWKTSRMLVDGPDSEQGYLRTWRASRWMGLNQLAIVVDVRAPLVLLGLLLGETAVGLYGFVQRTTAVVELAWASISKLLLKSYAEDASLKGGRVVQQHVRRASWVTGTAMIVGIAGVWIGVHYIERLDRWSEDVRTGLALLRWAAVAIGLSSLKRPLVLGLIALHHEREVCTVNVLSAAAGLTFIPFLIWSLSIWGPLVAAVGCETGAIVLLAIYFRAALRRLEAETDHVRNSRWVSGEPARYDRSI